MKQKSGLPYVLLLSLFWGVNAVASRYGIGQFDPFLFILLRLVIASLFMVPILLLVQGKLPTERMVWQQAAVSGILGVAIPIPAFILSLQYQSSGVASLYVTTLPVMIVIVAHFVLPDEKMSRNKLLGVVIALSGALFLALRGESGLAGVERASPLGAILVIGGLCSEVCNAMFVRLRMKTADPMQVTAVRLFVAALVLLVVTLLVGDFSLAQVNSFGYLSLGYAALFGALTAQFLAFYIQRTFGATVFSYTSFLVPVVATLFGALLLDEIVTWSIGVGMVLIGIGLFLLNRATQAAMRQQ